MQSSVAPKSLVSAAMPMKFVYYICQYTCFTLTKFHSYRRTITEDCLHPPAALCRTHVPSLTSIVTTAGEKQSCFTALLLGYSPQFNLWMPTNFLSRSRSSSLPSPCRKASLSILTRCVEIAQLFRASGINTVKNLSNFNQLYFQLCYLLWHTLGLPPSPARSLSPCSCLLGSSCVRVNFAVFCFFIAKQI